MTSDNAGRHVAAEWARARSLRDAAGKELAAVIFERAAGVSREEAERLAQACDALMAAVEPLLGRPGPPSG